MPTKLKIEVWVHSWYLSSTAAHQIYASIVDITERKEIRNRLKQQLEDFWKLPNNCFWKTNNELDRFVYSASHDFGDLLLKSLLGLFDYDHRSIKPGNTVWNKNRIGNMMKEQYS